MWKATGVVVVKKFGLSFFIIFFRSVQMKFPSQAMRGVRECRFER